MNNINNVNNICRTPFIQNAAQVMWFILANQHLPIQVNGKINEIKTVIEKEREGKEIPETRALPEIGTEL